MLALARKNLTATSDHDLSIVQWHSAHHYQQYDYDVP